MRTAGSEASCSHVICELRVLKNPDIALISTIFKNDKLFPKDRLSHDMARMSPYMLK